MNRYIRLIIGFCIASTTGVVIAQAKSNITPVSVDNFSRAETDTIMAYYVHKGKLGVFHHAYKPTPITEQKVVRMNRDTLYSIAIFDLDVGPVTLTLPETNGRYMTAQSIDEEHYTDDVFDARKIKTRTYFKKGVGTGDIGIDTRYMALVVRTMVAPQNNEDVKAANKLQNEIKVSQNIMGETKAKFNIPNWDSNSQTRLRDALKVLGTTITNSDQMFGSKENVNPIHHLIGAAVGWGGLPSSNAVYIPRHPKNNDGKHTETLTVKNVPVNGFWSISVYDSEGYFKKNSLNSYSVNSITAAKNKDGSVTIQFGNCTDNTPNCIPVMPGWNYTVRLYEPRKKLLDGSWTFPQINP